MKLKNLNNHHQVTEYFPIRKSIRKTKKQVQREQENHIAYLINSGIEEGLECRYIKGKGRGVFTTKSFEKGAFIVEYCGDFLSLMEANLREKKYASDKHTGCYMYYFKFNEQNFCIDATQETNKMGRLINHSKNNSNLYTKIMNVDGLPRLVLFAKENIKTGQELLYDYGDRRKESLIYHPWLKN